MLFLPRFGGTTIVRLSLNLSAPGDLRQGTGGRARSPHNILIRLRYERDPPPIGHTKRHICRVYATIYHTSHDIIVLYVMCVRRYGCTYASCRKHVISFIVPATTSSLNTLLLLHSVKRILLYYSRCTMAGRFISVDAHNNNNITKSLVYVI